MDNTPETDDRRAAYRDSGDPAVIESTETFLAHRNLLFTVAYELLGSAVDAEDVLQETWLRWHAVGSDQIVDSRAGLVRIVTRQALNRLRSVQRRGESHVGPWLPAPLPTAPDAAHDVELAESMAMALMLVLETLTPTERAVFVLREAFDLGYDEIAAAVGKAPTAVRQIAHRARRHVAVRRPHRAVSADQARQAADSLRHALETGEPRVLLDVLAPDVVLVSDGGDGRAATRPVRGADRVVRFIVGGIGKSKAAPTYEPVVVNGNAALAVHTDGELDGIMAIGTDGARVTGLYFVRNPAEPSRIDSENPLTLR
ncbi:sigma-70 family RNA polymerase sigma factor [Nocardia otitidiscaviarum]|uniref:Sigma-70 family RNA polymerase sigma factor n=1 Tax=Nocardia otitidiscaviarum TaxID=1823 RepID=A0A516NHA6_9NOCA|nr:sigma-70 family RNA polymerase sigma factor [Nocardia otitidiscaviarum]MCP9623532.1 sigma-70 family RNA polymerase sigma factor [Nocardia otitidiscaviarum]QDP78286.1 sigma-70 family RNA polymerase sigma factor [Nocardia otitidiscaviarum]